MLSDKLNIKLDELASQQKFTEYENLIYEELDKRSPSKHKEEVIYLGKLLCEVKFHQKKYNELEIILLELIKLFPENSVLYGQLALTYIKLEKKKEAEAFYKKGIDLDETNYEINFNFIVFLQKEKRNDEVISICQRLIEAGQNPPELLFVLGNAYKEKGKYRKSIFYYKKSIELDSLNDRAFYNLGVVYSHIDNYVKAIACYNEAIKINPDNRDARWNKSLLLLADGNFEQGWEEYEFRNDKPEALRKYDKSKIWQGENLDSKSILVLWEQGFGDALQFIRLLLLLKKMDAKVYFECKDKLIELIKPLDFIDEVIIKGEETKVNYDYCIPVMSLPFMLKLKLTDLPILESYLPFPKKNGITEFEFLDESKLKIGVCWQGSKNNISDAYRSTSYKNFIDLSKIPGIQLISLQYGLEADLKEELKLQKIIVFEENFEKTAKLISCLDIIITVDTSIAHLAAGMGKEVWNLLCYNCDWRWMRGRKDTPWYSSMKLIRQNKKDDWNNVFNEAKVLIWQRLLRKEENINDLNFVTQFLNFIKQLIDDCNYYLISDLYEEFKTSKLFTPELMNIFGVSLVKAEKIEEGLELIETALNNEPANLSYNVNKATVLLQIGKISEGMKILKELEKSSYQNAGLQYNIGVAKQEASLYDEAMAHYENAINIDSKYPEAIFNKSLILLQKGFWKKGFKGFEERKKIYVNRFKKFDTSEWNGEDLKGKSIIIYSDEGFGDIIQFSRYIYKLKELGAFVAFECKEELLTLFRNLNICDRLISASSNEKNHNQYDYYAELLSLPNLLIDIIPDIPAVFSGFSEIESEKELCAEKLNVGIVWEGNKNFQYYDKKVCDPIELIKCVSLTNVNICNLQFDVTDPKVLNYFDINSVNNYIEDAEDFNDTAGKIKNLDLVISIDTAIAHLAGSLNIPTWILLHKTADWRWGETEKSVWYPSVKLFRQKQQGNWQSVFEEIKNELKNFIVEKNGK